MTASVASGFSPHSGIDTDESNESFVMVGSYGGTSSSTSSIAYWESPSSGSFQSFAFVGQQPQFMPPSPPAVSPYALEVGSDAAAPLSGDTFGDGDGCYDFQAASTNANPDQLDLSNSDINESQEPLGLGMMPEEWSVQYQGLSTFLTTPSPDILQNNNPGLEFISGFSDIEIPQSMMDVSNVLPWNSTNIQQDGMFLVDGFTSPPAPTSVSISPVIDTVGPVSPQLKQEASSAKASIPSPIRRVRGTGARVEKKRATSSSDSSSLGSSPTSKFVIMTPNTISAHAGKTNPYESQDATRPSQRGRKGPLANATKENALQVRRRGACFHCHARKVKCDMDRPCKNCQKLITDIPQVICWRFTDFVPILFPMFIRGHFDNKAVYSFSKDNVRDFRIHGLERPCEVVMSSGLRFATTLRVHAKYFTAKGDDVTKHWHLSVQGHLVQLHNEASAPIGLETLTESPKDELKKMLNSSLRGYFEALIKEPAFAEQVTETLVQKSVVPRFVMQIVHQFFQSFSSPPELVRRALLICAMHYVMTRQLTILATEEPLESRRFSPQGRTSRLLNRQIKTIIDDLMQKEMVKIFDDFSRSLKSKSKKEWAPCLAAFLVLCLFMESIESATDLFVISENEISLNQTPPSLSFDRKDAREVNREIENMPFKQFAFQFHQVFMTHTKDASAKAFNPLIDNSILESDDLDEQAKEMTRSLRDILDVYNGDLVALAEDPLLPNIERHPYPSNTGDRYVGYLTARFLLSFTDDGYIFGPKSP